MNVAKGPLELEARWSDWQLARNKKGMKGALWIGVCLYPAFGVLDYLMAPPRWLSLLYGTRVAVTASVFGSRTNVFRSRQPWIVQPAPIDAHTAFPAVRTAIACESKPSLMLFCAYDTPARE